MSAAKNGRKQVTYAATSIAVSVFANETSMSSSTSYIIKMPWHEL